MNEFLVFAGTNPWLAAFFFFFACITLVGFTQSIGKGIAQIIHGPLEDYEDEDLPEEKTDERLNPFQK
jgi:hypothetical protein